MISPTMLEIGKNEDPGVIIKELQLIPSCVRDDGIVETGTGELTNISASQRGRMKLPLAIYMHVKKDGDLKTLMDHWLPYNPRFILVDRHSRDIAQVRYRYTEWALDYVKETLYAMDDDGKKLVSDLEEDPYRGITSEMKIASGWNVLTAIRNLRKVAEQERVVAVGVAEETWWLCGRSTSIEKSPTKPNKSGLYAHDIARHLRVLGRDFNQFEIPARLGMRHAEDTFGSLKLSEVGEHVTLMTFAFVAKRQSHNLNTVREMLILRASFPKSLRTTAMYPRKLNTGRPYNALIQGVDTVKDRLGADTFDVIEHGAEALSIAVGIDPKFKVFVEEAYAGQTDGHPYGT